MSHPANGNEIQTLIALNAPHLEPADSILLHAGKTFIYLKLGITDYIMKHINGCHGNVNV